MDLVHKFTSLRGSPSAHEIFMGDGGGLYYYHGCKGPNRSEPRDKDSSHMALTRPLNILSIHAST